MPAKQDYTTHSLDELNTMANTKSLSHAILSVVLVVIFSQEGACSGCKYCSICSCV